MVDGDLQYYDALEQLRLFGGPKRGSRSRKSGAACQHQAEYYAYYKSSDPKGF